MPKTYYSKSPQGLARQRQAEDTVRIISVGGYHDANNQWVSLFPDSEASVPTSSDYYPSDFDFYRPTSPFSLYREGADDNFVLARRNSRKNSGAHDSSRKSVIARFPLKDDEGVNFVAWTNTPWTLPSNIALCVHPTIEYVKILDKTTGGRYILAKSRLPKFFQALHNKKKWKSGIAKEFYKVEATYHGKDLVGRKYKPLHDSFSCDEDSEKYFRVISDCYVAEDVGTGIVHQAPAFSKDDYRVCLAHGLIQKGKELPSHLASAEAGSWEEEKTNVGPAEPVTEEHGEECPVGEKGKPGDKRRTGYNIVFEVTQETTQQAAQRMYLERAASATNDGRLAILNFASAKNPGGGFLRGSQAQEECLARASTLYGSIGPWKDAATAGVRFSDGKHPPPMFYDGPEVAHRDLLNNKGIPIADAAHRNAYSDRIMYSRDVCFFRDESQELLSDLPSSLLRKADIHYADVITCAAVDMKRYRKGPRARAGGGANARKADDVTSGADLLVRQVSYSWR